MTSLSIGWICLYFLRRVQYHSRGGSCRSPRCGLSGRRRHFSVGPARAKLRSESHFQLHAACCMHEGLPILIHHPGSRTRATYLPHLFPPSDTIVVCLASTPPFHRVLDSLSPRPVAIERDDAAVYPSQHYHPVLRRSPSIYHNPSTSHVSHR
jgi:hypothetical protein